MLTSYAPVPVLLWLALAVGCEQHGTKQIAENPSTAIQDTMHTHTNRLIHESSPYLLQHAHNPVDWYPWGEEAFTKAREENKLLLISIGYSSCHWCHVMERESFENDSVAKVMNERFVCIKVDREERPDVDQVYMTAVQLMTGRGGWPLNCFALADGRPVYGGTYFPPDQWEKVLMELHGTWTNDPKKVEEYANRLQQGVAEQSVVQVPATPAEFDRKDLRRMVDAWMPNFDNVHGGPDRAPKFPMPNNYEFLLRYAWLTDDDVLKRHVALTLDKMALGGINDRSRRRFLAVQHGCPLEGPALREDAVRQCTACFALQPRLPSVRRSAVQGHCGANTSLHRTRNDFSGRSVLQRTGCRQRR